LYVKYFDKFSVKTKNYPDSNPYQYDNAEMLQCVSEWILNE